MKKRIIAGLFATAVFATLSTIPAQAGCIDSGTCITRAKTTKQAAASRSTSARKAVKTSRHAQSRKAGWRKAGKRTAHAGSRKSRRSTGGLPASPEANSVIAMIRSMAPGQGVPTWFALRIAKVESNYNPRARGRAGELGVFQLKCNTARGIGYSGSCSGLLDARTNIHYGLKHLSIAMHRSGGNLRLAASKHNGGLGRKTEVRGYVAKVF